MTSQTRCPKRADLIRLTHGDLPGDRFDSVCRHVESCGKCQRRLSELEDESDPFANAFTGLRQADLDSAREKMETESQLEMSTVRGMLAASKPPQRRKAALRPPCQLGPYEIRRLLGYGGMGEVYEARHSRLDRLVALKVIRGYRQGDPVSHIHFLKEMATAGKFDHPNLVRAYDAWEADGCLYLALELVEGNSLQKLARAGAIRTASEVLAAITQTCRALEHLHANHLVHRDVKPGNIMRLQDGSIKLIDYGLAITSESNSKSGSKAAGTKGYMSPEQARGSRNVDHRSDIFSAGRVLQSLLKRLDDSALEPQQADLAQRLALVAASMTRPDPEERPQEVADVITQLENLSQDTGERTTRFSRRSTGWIAGVLIAIFAAGAALTAWQISFTTDRQATVVVENHQPDDVIVLSSDDGDVQSVDLGDRPQFAVAPGTYRLSLESPDNRRLSPAHIKLTGLEQLTVRVEDIPPAIPQPVDAANSPPATVQPVDAEDTPPATVQTADPKSSEPASKPFEIEMVEIPAGRFVMGAAEGDPDARSHESPRRTVEFASPFQMSAHEVTVAQFREFVEATGYVTEAESSGDGGWKASQSTSGWTSWGEQRPDIIWSSPGYQVSERLPVTVVTYADATAFCHWLSNRNQKHYRLPTEAEWEYACRAGSTGIFSFPRKARDSYCWSRYNTQLLLRPHPVGMRQPNDWGLFDTCGNVREWCVDWYSEDAYQRPIRNARSGPAHGDVRVIRGGCFMDLETFLRSSNRGFLDPNVALNNQGFRIVSEKLGDVNAATEFDGSTSTDSTPSLPASRVTAPLAPTDGVAPQTLSAPFTPRDILAATKAWSAHLSLPEAITLRMPDNPSFALELVLIPPGSFDMGMPETLSLLPGNKPEWAATSRPERRVTISRPFYLSRYEVTQKQFRDVIGEGMTPVTGDGTRYPATQIYWQWCVNFCNRLSESGIEVPRGGRVRLPTEAEWEYACRAGTTTRFWGGNQIGPEEASLRNRGRGLTLEPVGSFEPNPFGLYDMHGNVSEWCLDWFSPTSYATAAAVDPTGPQSGSRRVIRGGGYSNPPFSATSYWRQSYEPDTRSGNIGFRPVLEL